MEDDYTALLASQQQLPPPTYQPVPVPVPAQPAPPPASISPYQPVPSQAAPAQFQPVPNQTVPTSLTAFPSGQAPGSATPTSLPFQQPVTPFQGVPTSIQSLPSGGFPSGIPPNNATVHTQDSPAVLGALGSPPPSLSHQQTVPLLLTSVVSSPQNVQQPGTNSLQMINGMQVSAGHAGIQKGVIYAFSQYSPFISLSSTSHTPLSNSGDNENSNLGPEDVAEVRQMTSAAAAAAAPVHEHERTRTDSGKCQSGGELRLSELVDKLNQVHVSEGFCLVGAKSPMLPGMVLVAAVDKRYLPGDADSITMLGFSGNCVGCGASGFRYFTEFSTHINLKLATQPKKQKHLKYYITKNSEGIWCRGPVIPWKGTETRKRSVPAYNLPLLHKSLEGMSSYTESSMSSFNNENSNKDQMSSLDSSIDSSGEPETKKIKAEIRNEKKNLANFFMATSSDDTNPMSSATEVTDSNQSVEYSEDVALKLPVSVICGVRPVLLLCQQYSCRLPNSVSDIIVSDLLVGCFDFPETIYQPSASTASKYVMNTASIMSTGVVNSNDDEKNKARTNTSEPTGVAETLVDLGVSTDTNAVTNKTVPLVDGNNNSSNVTSSKKESMNINLPLSAAIILMTQHLCSLEDTSINKEQIELMFSKAKIEIAGSTSSTVFNSQIMITSGVQLSLIVNLQCSASNGRVRLISSNHSFQNGLYKALRWIHDTFYMSSVSNKKLMIPNFVIILSTPPGGPIEFGILVTGVSHAKILAECLGINTIVRSPFEDDLVRLKKQFQLTTEVLRNLITMFDETRGDMVYVPFNAYSGMRIKHALALEHKPTVAPHSATPIHTKGVFPNQAAMAQQLLTQLRNVAENPEVLDLPSFLKVDLLIVVPPTITLYYLTVKRLCESGILTFLGLETEERSDNYDVGGKYVITYSEWPDAVKIWNDFVQKTVSSPETLFLLIFDQAQRYSLPNGMPDVLPNLKEILGSTNVIPVFVTSVPYMFQTRKSFIDPDNEVYWTDSKQGTGSAKYLDDQRVLINDQDMIYFGIKELCESMQWNQQYALVRHEETFDSAVPKANRLNDINYSMVQGFVLLRLYQASMMVSGGIKPAEPYTVMSVINMVNDMVESPLRNPDGSGYMLMIRIPNKQLGKYFHKVLQKTRYSLGFQYRFDIIYDDGESELKIDEYFLERMRIWKVKSGWDQEKADKWKPRCIEELLDLPCFLILAGEDRSGETFPRSLKYVDLNIFNHSSFHRSTIETEIGSIACYLGVDSVTYEQIASKPAPLSNLRSGFGNLHVCQLRNELLKDGTPSRTSYPFDKSSCHGKCDGCLNKDHTNVHADTNAHFTSKYPLPLVLVSKPVWHLLQSDRGTAHGLIHLNSDPHTRWIQSDRPLLTNMKPDRMSRYYRRWTDARPVRKVLTTPCFSSYSSPNGEDGQTDDIAKLFSYGKDLDPEKQIPEGNVYLSEQLDYDDKDNEETDKDRYHPRALLLSGPPQAGKTGAYLHFAYLLHRMLVRLKRVDVYDNRITYTPSIEAITARWPDHNALVETKFVAGFLDMRQELCSSIHVCSSDFENTHQIVAQHREKGTDNALVILAKTSAFDVFHNCDVCRLYREAVVNSPASVYSYQLQNFGVENRTVEFKVVIPHTHMKYFIVDETTGVLLSLLLQLCDDDKAGSRGNPSLATKSPILMFSAGGEEEGLLNLYHAMMEKDHIHMTFIKSGELVQYQKFWPNHIFFVLPPEFDNGSDSAIKNIIKAFATQNYHNEIARWHDLQPETGLQVWPFVLIVPDNIVMWQKTGKNVPHDSSDSEDEDEVGGNKNKGNSESGTSGISPLPDTSSLLELLLTLESYPSIREYGLIGFRPWSSHQDQSSMPTCLRTFVQSCFMMNIAKTEQVSFDPNIFIGDDVDLQLRLIEEGILTCRFEHFSYMAKMTSRTTWRGADNLPTTNSLGLTVDTHSHLVVAPDNENVQMVNADSHLVMQKYLHASAEVLFPLPVKDPNLHVLVIGCYVNLGPRISTCVINCRASSDELITPGSCETKKAYGGLIVYNCAKKLSRDSLSCFQFVKDAQMVLICRERYELRSEVMRLDLEEYWRFRLRDEYQTATSSDDNRKAFYFLTGSYIKAS